MESSLSKIVRGLSAKVLGARIAIHDGLELDELAPSRAVVRAEALTSFAINGAIIGTAVVASYVSQSSSEWFMGPFGWYFLNTRVLKKPIPCKGAQGLWRLSKSLIQSSTTTATQKDT
jgi:hypothetical protein